MRVGRGLALLSAGVLVTAGLPLVDDSFMVYNSSAGNVEVSIDQSGRYLGSVA